MIFLSSKIKFFINEILLVALICCLAISCSMATTRSSYVETKSGTANGGPLEKNKKTVIYSSRYKVTAQASLVKCKGDGFTVELYSDYSLELNGLANCGLAGEINLSDYAKEPAKEYDDSNTKYKTGEYDGLLIRAPNPQKDTSNRVPEGLAYFNPPRPNLVNPVLREDELRKYIGETITEESKVTIGLPKGVNASHSGAFKITVHSVDSSIPSEVGSSVAPLGEDGKVVVFTIASTGFKSVKKKGSYMIYDSMKMWVGTDPIAVYKMEIKSKLLDVADEKDVAEKKDNNPLLQKLSGLGWFGSLASLIVDSTISKVLQKDINITATLTDYISVSDKSSKSKDNDDDD